LNFGTKLIRGTNHELHDDQPFWCIALNCLISDYHNIPYVWRLDLANQTVKTELKPGDLEMLY